MPSATLPQTEGYQHPNSPNRNGYPNGHGIQKPCNNHPVKKIGEEQEERLGVPVVAINGNASGAEAERVSITDSPSLNGANSNGSIFSNGSQQLVTPTMQPVVDLDSSSPPTSAALAPPSATSSPITPTPSSMSFMFQQRNHPAQLDLSSQLEVPGSIQSPESSSNSNTPRTSSAVLLSSSGEDDEEDQKVREVTKTIIPDSSTVNRDGVSITPTTGSSNGLTVTSNSQPQVPTQSPSTQQPSTNPPPTSATSPPTASTPSDPATSGPIPTPTTTPTAAASFSAPPSTPPPMPVPVPTPHVYIKVRDFGFPPTDERHLGLGTDIPKANRVQRLNRKLGGPDRARARAAAATIAALGSSSAAAASGSGSGSRRPESFASVASVDSSDADAEEEEEDGDDDGWGMGMNGWGKGAGGKEWGGFRMGMGRFSWTIGSSHPNIPNLSNASDIKNDSSSHSKVIPSNSNGTFPSRKDLDMNFMDSSSSSSDEDRPRGPTTEQGYTETFDMDYDDSDDFDQNPDYYEDDDDEVEGDDDQVQVQVQEPLYPGLYRALYAFEPEGTAEMKLSEDQIVRVVGRGGGVGWAVVVDELGGRGGGGGGGGVEGPAKHALVPEGYLEAVRLDWEDEVEEEEDGDGEGEGKAGDA